MASVYLCQSQVQEGGTVSSNIAANSEKKTNLMCDFGTGKCVQKLWQLW